MGYHSPRLLLSALALGVCPPVPALASTEDATTESRVEAANLTLVEGTGGVTQAVFVIKLKYTPTGSQDYVEYELLPGTATPGVDYEPIPAGRLDFAAGEIQKTLTVNVVADEQPECPEGFGLRLQHWFHGRPMDVTATIVDDDGVDGGVAPLVCPDPVAIADSAVAADAGIPPDPLDAAAPGAHQGLGLLVLHGTCLPRLASGDAGTACDVSASPRTPMKASGNLVATSTRPRP